MYCKIVYACPEVEKKLEEVQQKYGLKTIEHALNFLWARMRIRRIENGSKS